MGRLRCANFFSFFFFAKLTRDKNNVSVQPSVEEKAEFYVKKLAAAQEEAKRLEAKVAELRSQCAASSSSS